MGFKSASQRKAVFARLLARARMLRKSGMLQAARIPIGVGRGRMKNPLRLVQTNPLGSGILKMLRLKGNFIGPRGSASRQYVVSSGGKSSRKLATSIANARTALQSRSNVRHSRRR